MQSSALLEKQVSRSSFVLEGDNLRKSLVVKRKFIVRRKVDESEAKAREIDSPSNSIIAGP